jgi:uncharacterized protein with von Willebrand factor type A (vWA) domain
VPTTPPPAQRATPDLFEATEAVRRHPRVVTLGETGGERLRAASFAHDLAAWLAGAETRRLRPLARVVVAVSGQGLVDTRSICAGLPLLAVESAARLAEALWPLVRWADPSPPERDPPPPAPPSGGPGGPEQEGQPGEEGASGEGTSGAAASAGEGGAAGDEAPGAEAAEGSPAEGDGCAGERAEAAPAAGAEGEPDAAHGEEEADGSDGETDEEATAGDRAGGAGAGAATGAAPAAGGADAGSPGLPEPTPTPRDGGGDPTAAALAGARRLLHALGETGGEAPELDALAAKLSEGNPGDPEAATEALAKAAKRATAEAWQGAQDGEELARLVERLVPGMGWGGSPGALQRAMLERLDPYVKLLERLPELREIAEKLGRLEDDARQQRPEPGGGEDVSGVMFGGEFSRALPSELALLADPELEDLFLLRWQERRLLSLELTGGGLDGVAGAGRRGPVIAAVDTSGSMRGPPGVIAKAVLLAVIRRVVPEGRAVHVLLFGSAVESTELRFRRGGGGLEDLLAFLAVSFDGGTDFDTPLARGLALLDERDLRDADLLVVTDGYARASDTIEAAVATARRERGVRCFSVIVPGGTDDGVLSFSDQVWRLELGAGEAVSLVREVGAVRGGWRGNG